MVVLHDNPTSSLVHAIPCNSKQLVDKMQNTKANLTNTSPVDVQSICGEVGIEWRHLNRPRRFKLRRNNSMGKTWFWATNWRSPDSIGSPQEIKEIVVYYRQWWYSQPSATTRSSKYLWPHRSCWNTVTTSTAIEGKSLGTIRYYVGSRSYHVRFRSCFWKCPARQIVYAEKDRSSNGRDSEEQEQDQTRRLGRRQELWEIRGKWKRETNSILYNEGCPRGCNHVDRHESRSNWHSMVCCDGPRCGFVCHCNRTSSGCAANAAPKYWL